MAFELRVAALKLILRAGVGVGRLLYRLKIEGTEHIPSQGACIIAGNNQGAIGNAVVAYPILARRTLESLGGFGGEGMGGRRFPLRRWMRRLYRLETAQGRRFLRAYKAQGQSAPELLRALELLCQGKALILAVEGEMAWDGRLQPLQPGAAWLALRAHVPVVPIVTIGAYDIVSRWTNWPRLRGRLTVRVGQPFYVSDGPCSRVTNEMVQEAGQKIWKELAALMARGV